MTCAAQTRDAACLSLARPLFAADVAVSVTDPRADPTPPMPEEAASLARCVPRRRREFAAGRAAVRRAQAALGHPAAPVPMGVDRAPVWPRGTTGSISHSRTACIAVLASCGVVRALGVDVEEDDPLDPHLFDTICTPGEQERLAHLSPFARGRAAKLVFSAKECAYKCQYAVSRSLFDFHALEVHVDPETGGFDAVFRCDTAAFAKGRRLTGRYAVGDGLIVTGMTLRT